MLLCASLFHLIILLTTLTATLLSHFYVYRRNGRTSRSITACTARRGASQTSLRESLYGAVHGVRLLCMCDVMETIMNHTIMDHIALKRLEPLG